MKNNFFRAEKSAYKRWQLLVMLLLLLFWVSPVSAKDEAVPFDVVKIISKDELGKAMKLPVSLFYHPKRDEIYLVAGGSKIIVYGPEPVFLPVFAFGEGRGITKPYGVFVDENDRIYVCQDSGKELPPRVTVFNAALFIEREIVFNTLDGLENFKPAKVAKQKNGFLYVAGQNSEGVVVLDDNGKYIRHIIPVVEKYSGRLQNTVTSLQELRSLLGKEDKVEQAAKDEMDEETRQIIANLPAELRPKTAQQQEKTEKAFEFLPVKVNTVIIDAKGRLYLGSEELSRIFVYDRNENFLFSFGQKGGASGKLSRPRGVAVDDKKNWAYVVDYMRHTILVYDLNKDGKFMFEFGGQGMSPGWFNYPQTIAVNKDGYVIVGDYFNSRVQIIDVLVEYHEIEASKQKGKSSKKK